MGGLFSGGETPAVVQPAPPPSRSDAEVKQAAYEARMRRASAVGRSSTVATGPQGATEDAPTASKKLLGSANV